MKNNFENLENSIKQINNKSINDIIQDDENLFNYKNIKSMSFVLNFYNKVKKIYEKSIFFLENKVSYLQKLKKWMISQINSEEFYYSKKSKNIFSDLFLEIESTLAFVLINFTPDYELVMQYNFHYHHLQSMLIYIYSSFDKIACILYFHFLENEQDEIDIEKLKNVKFVHLSTYINFDHKIKQGIKKIIESNSFRYLKNVRNSFHHHHHIPYLRYHFSFDIMICFIVLIELVSVLQNNL